MTHIRTEATRGRRDVVDFWRGFVLCTIFINHVPGNVFERVTYRNLGLSDSAEAFVFISGLSLALAYGGRFVVGGRKPVLLSLLRRAVRLYGVHIGLSLGGLAIFAIGVKLTADPGLMQVHGRDLFLRDPVTGLVGLLSLGHQLGYFNILPMYILLVAAVPGLFWLACRSRVLMLACSLALYLLCRGTGFNLPNWPIPGTWFFDPFAWQLMVAIGVAAGFTLKQGALPRSGILVGLSGVIVLASWFAVSNGFTFVPGLWDWTRSWADLDKTMLGAGRLVHFLALAYLVYVLGIGDAMRRTPVFKPLCVIGRNGLWAFAFLSLLAAVEQVIAVVTGHSIGVDVVLIGGGLTLLYGVTRIADARRKSARSAAANVVGFVEPSLISPTTVARR